MSLTSRPNCMNDLAFGLSNRHVTVASRLVRMILNAQRLHALRRHVYVIQFD